MSEQLINTALTSSGSLERRPVASPPAEVAVPDPRIEDYVDHVCAPLVGLVPYARRQELRAELRGHLEALAATHEELGSSREAAVVMALRQFGPPRDIARQWAREWVAGASSTVVQPPWRATLIALGSFGAATAAVLVFMGLWIAANPPYVDPGIGVVGLAGALLPAWAGLVTGLRAPARPVLGTFYALALLILPAAGLAGHALAQPGCDGSHVLSLGLSFMQPLLWMPIGCLMAAVGGAQRDRRSLQPRGWVLQ